MKFNKLDEKLRVYETAYDFSVPPNNYIVARIDGRSFTRLTKELHDFEKPFDNRFREMMLQTTEHLMNCGFSIQYAYTQSDEISLLFSLEDNSFSRKTRKVNSVLAGEASAKFSLLLGSVASFDSRLSILPSKKLVVDYFRWRNEDAHRNALNAHCYWLLRNEGKSKTEATNLISGQSTSFKNELLFQHGINFNNLPMWQKRGSGLYWENVVKEGWNPVKQEKTQSTRRKVKINTELPLGEDYTTLLETILSNKI